MAGKCDIIDKLCKTLSHWRPRNLTYTEEQVHYPEVSYYNADTD